MTLCSEYYDILMNTSLFNIYIFCTCRFIRPEVHTTCMGQAASMGSLLLTAGTPGKRFALPNARIMLHQPSGGAQVSASSLHATTNLLTLIFLLIFLRYSGHGI